MKKLFRALLVAIFVAALFSCNKSGDTIRVAPSPALTEEEGKYVRTLDTSEKGKWVTIEYTAKGADGSIQNLSELIYLPVGQPAHLAIGCHITITSDDERPSNFKNLSVMTDVGVLTRMLSGLNAMAVFPDYEGFGSTRANPHPYLNRDVTARQCLAGAKAALDWLTREKKMTMASGWKSIAIGYSQGGAVAAGILRYYKENSITGLNLTAAICGDGPYDPLITLRHYILEDKIYMPVAAILVLKGLVDTHPDLMALGCTYADFAAPEIIDTGIFEILDRKEFNTGQIQRHLLDCSSRNNGFTMKNDGMDYCEASQCFRESVVAYFRDGTLTGDVPEAKLRTMERALKENSLTYGDWIPDADSHFFLYHSTRDEVVPFANYEAVLSAWGEDCIDGRPYEDPDCWTHLDVGTRFITTSASFVQKYIL